MAVNLFLYLLYFDSHSSVLFSETAYIAIFFSYMHFLMTLSSMVCLEGRICFVRHDKKTRNTRTTCCEKN